MLFPKSAATIRRGTLTWKLIFVCIARTRLGMHLPIPLCRQTVSVSYGQPLPSLRVRVQCRQIQIPKVGADRNEEIIPANRLTQPAATIRTCTDKQRTFFVPTLGICI